MNTTPKAIERGEQDSEDLFPTYIPLRKAMKALRISRKTAYVWNAKGRLEFVKRDGRIHCATAQVLRIKFRMEDERNDW